VSVTLKNETIASKDLVALQTVEKGGIFRRLYDAAVMMIRKNDGE
jgi:D-alanyl-D-alanine carboxypeptidase (penicillin-binding protein 5/6)